MYYLVQPRDICKRPQNIGKNVHKILSPKYSQKLPDQASQSAKDALKTASKRAIQKNS